MGEACVRGEENNLSWYVTKFRGGAAHRMGEACVRGEENNLSWYVTKFRGGAAHESR